MPYIMPFLLGFFDHTAAARGEVRVRKQLDLDLANCLLAEAGDQCDRGFVYIGPDRFTVQEGYVRCWDAPHRPGADFMIRFARETGCEIYDWDALVIESADTFARNFEEFERMRAGRRERGRKARKQAEL